MKTEITTFILFCGLWINFSYGQNLSNFNQIQSNSNSKNSQLALENLNSFTNLVFLNSNGLVIHESNYTTLECNLSDLTYLQNVDISKLNQITRVIIKISDSNTMYNLNLLSNLSNLSQVYLVFEFEINEVQILQNCIGLQSNWSVYFLISKPQ